RVIGGETGQRAVEEAVASDGLPAESQAVHDPRAEVLDEHIGRVDQVVCVRQISPGLQVKDEALLATLQGGIGRCLPAWSAGWVDMDDLRALVSQEQSGEGAGQPLAQINHPDAVQCSIHASPPVAVSADRAALASSGHQRKRAFVLPIPWPEVLSLVLRSTWRRA